MSEAQAGGDVAARMGNGDLAVVQLHVGKDDARTKVAAEQFARAVPQRRDVRRVGGHPFERELRRYAHPGA